MRWTIGIILAAAAGTSSCTKETGPAESRDRGAAGSAEKKKDDVGVGDVVDYAIGKKQLEVKKHIEGRLKTIEADRNRRLEEQMEE